MTLINADNHRVRPVPTWMPLTDKQIIRGSAFHEAAHAVVGMALGGRCESLSIFSVQHNGLTAWTGVTCWNETRAFSPLGFAVMAAAGAVGELAQLAADGLLTAELAAIPRGTHDRDTAINCCAAAGFTITLHGDAPADPDQGTSWTEVTKTTQGMVNDLWPAITALAEALLQAPGLALTGDAAAAIINPHL
ncbi:hypothetical protein ACFRSX_32680 [Streptomyces goshikiensis]|uniref:hypothetical protein n=1 Tax=Streptomyces TaxID=1883 RepID=UPI000C28002F|nr:hypothetical protein [Streptomyces sp. CB02120-2]PJN14539.1 hypothetical protein CG724_33130 [Streptomyces sp. CB02120-2]